MHAGTQQDKRILEALRPGYFMPDEIGLEERIRLTLAQACQLKFVARDGVQAGLWSDALLRDETVVLADVAAYPLEKEGQEFLQLVSWEQKDKLWQRIWQMVLRYDRWCQCLLESEDVDVGRVGEAMLVQIRLGLANMLAPAMLAWSAPMDGLHTTWQVGLTAQVQPVLDAGAQAQLLRRCSMGLCQAILKVQPLAKAALAGCMTSGRHDPAMGLLLASLQLVQYSRVPVNRIPERLTDFYYRDVLNLQPRQPAVERVHLLLERDPHYGAPVRIEAGARFAGGKNAAGLPIVFAADQALEVSDIQVAALHCLRVERDELISPEQEFDYPKGIKAQSIPVQSPEAAYQAFPAWWPLLGGQARGAASRGQDVTLGIAVTSSLLVMHEGVREIWLGLQLNHPADDDEGLSVLLHKSGKARTTSWLCQVFECYAKYEDKIFPLRPRYDRVTEQENVFELAQAAWQRSSEFDADVHVCFLLARCLAATQAAVFRERLGRLFAAWLIAVHENIRDCDLHALRAHARMLGVSGDHQVDIDDPLTLIHAPRSRPGLEVSNSSIDRALIFERVFTGVWQARVSTDQGWLTLGKVHTHQPSGEHAGNFGAFITLALQVGADMPPIVPCRTTVHGSQWPGGAALQLCMQTQTRMYAHSLLRQWIIRDIHLEVRISGLRNVVLYNQLGRLDPSKPFHPFGPTPGRSAYMVLGSAELASKPLQDMRLNVKWTGLPNAQGGFGEHYAGYPGYKGMDTFQVRGLVLMDGRWQAGCGQLLPLFQTQAQSRQLVDDNVLEFPSVDLRRWHRAAPSLQIQKDYQYDLNSRNGFFRFDLAASDMAFGHADYPGLLTETLTYMARNKKHMRALPREPYTPTIERLSVDYRASQILPLQRMGKGEAGNKIASRVFHVYASGLQAIDCAQVASRPSLLPAVPHDGNLFIGLQGTEPQGGLTLFFHLRKEEAAERWLDDMPALEWAVWAGGTWLRLEPSQILADSTRGMLCSGIVHLSLPAGMERGCPQLPGQLYWLRLGADWGFDLLAGLYGVHAQALCASRVEPATQADSPEPLPPGTIRQALPSVSGLRGITQVGTSFGRQAQDTAEQLLVRSAERLRHKQRASCVWDYERLILDAFPDVYKVKCFAHQFPTGQVGDGGRLVCQPCPGHVLIVVVPAPAQGHLFTSTEAPKIDAARIEEMAAYLRERSPEGVHLVVRNASYERIQVRCSVKLAADAHPGVVLRLINKMLVEFISPWHEVGYGCEFDWQIEAESLESCIRSLPQVLGVGQLSLLHIVCGDDRFYVMRDTARQSGQQYGMRKVTPTQPWSLALPVAQNLIELSGPTLDRLPKVTGMSHLELGNTFIVGGKSSDDAGEGAT